jgi:hypothetical protein
MCVLLTGQFIRREGEREKERKEEEEEEEEKENIDNQ